MYRQFRYAQQFLLVRALPQCKRTQRQFQLLQDYVRCAVRGAVGKSSGDIDLALARIRREVGFHVGPQRGQLHTLDLERARSLQRLHAKGSRKRDGIVGGGVRKKIEAAAGIGCAGNVVHGHADFIELHPHRLATVLVECVHPAAGDSDLAYHEVRRGRTRRVRLFDASRVCLRCKNARQECFAVAAPVYA